MNTLQGHITEVNSSDHLSLVSVKVGPFSLSSIIIDTPETTEKLQIGHSVQLVFKETEVIIGTGSGKQISLRN